MSVANTTPSPAATAGEGHRESAPAGSGRRQSTPAGDGRRQSLLRWVGGGLVTAAAVGALALAFWPATAADQAREDGEQLGQAVGQLYNAQSTADVEAALAEIDAAAADARDHAGDEVAAQVADQQDALAHAANGFVGAYTTGDAFEAELYQAELNVAIDDLTSQASDFRAQGPEVHEAYWQGFQDGLPGD
jgi:hypothetical protein